MLCYNIPKMAFFKLNHSKQKKAYLLLGLIFGLLISSDLLNHAYADNLDQSDCYVCNSFVIDIPEQRFLANSNFKPVLNIAITKSLDKIQDTSLFLVRAPPKI